MQHTSHLLMIKPVKFDFNTETAVNNRFQVNVADESKQQKALQEFTGLVNLLRSQQIDVMVIEDTPEPHTPDSIFPNNWISFHDNGNVYLYPMFAPNRRLERKQHVIDTISEKFDISGIIDLSGYEPSQLFLEGTGSMVLDRDNRIAYACLSPRTDEQVLAEFCQQEQYRYISFHSVDARRQPVYHTNVMMCVADRYVVICLDSIHDPAEKATVTEAIAQSGKEIIPISITQMNHFAGNMLQVNNGQGKTFLVMSSQAYQSLSGDQVSELQAYNHILHADISTIETNGGGSARCMLAEIFLPKK